jgi:uncharacterized membrane protein YhaH (DUF805 family)
MDWDFFFGFAGINRARCSRVMLLNLVVLMMFLLIVPLSIGSSFHNADPKWAAPLTLALLCGTIGPILVISTWCFVAISIKRLHDRNKSAWWMVLFFIVPTLLDKLGDWLNDPTATFIFGAIGLGLSIWSFVEIFCLKGTRGPNGLGSDPLTKGNISVHAIQRRYA